MRSSWPGTLVAVLAIALVGCAGGEGLETSEVSETSELAASSSTVPATVASTMPTTVPATVAATVPTTVPTTGASTMPTTVPATVPEGVLPGLAPIDLLTEEDGLGERPILRWEPVAGASEYVVVVNDLDGGPYWTWQGADAEVAFGGGPIDDPDTTGARLLTARTWFVVALDDTGATIAASERRGVAP